MRKTMPLLETKNITKVYGAGAYKVAVLKDVTLEVQKGEFVAITGKSGSGKSTLMNILGCLDIATSGTYKIESQDVSNLTVDQLAEIRNKKIGFVFQRYHLLPDMTALENVELPLLYANKPEKFARERSLEMLKLVGLADRVNHLPSELSGGEQQRVAVARALANKPAILLADEPTGNLDSATEERIMKLLRDMHKEHGVTIVIITHDEHIAQQADRIIKIHDGKIIQ